MTDTNHIQKELGRQIGELVRDFVKEKLEMILREEIKNFLENEEKEGHNSRNGYYHRILDTQFGRIEDLTVPRDRNGDFHTVLFEPYKRQNGFLEETILTLYQSGVSTRQIGKFVEQLLNGHAYSATTISNITETVREDIERWQRRPLEPNYFAVYLDALFFNVRRDTVEKEAIYLVLGLTLEGKRDILGFYVGGKESSSVWKEILEDLYHRGVQHLLLGIFDGLPGLETTFRRLYPKADVQRCIVHKMRNTLSKVRKVDQAELAADFRKVYKADQLEQAQEAFQKVKEKWGQKYKRVIESWENEWSVLMTFYKYPKDVRKFIYTTNMIERANKEIRKRLKPMNSLPSIEAVEKIVYLIAKNYNTHWTSKKTPGFGIASEEIYKIFKQRYGDEALNPKEKTD